MIRPISFALLGLMLLCGSVPSAFADEAFIHPAELEPDIAFWRRIYTEVTTGGGVIHDATDLGVVYEVMKLPSDLSPKQRSKAIEDTKKKYSRILERLASAAEQLGEEEQRVQALWPKGTRRSRFEQAAEEVRFQLGQADRFREGVVRSGAYRGYIASTFEKAGLPRELAALPHVESSFNTYAYSKVGAAGMWQFMRSTGRRFLRVDSVVDERLDPYRATDAAVKFLEQNYIVLGSWPLALTAYNHGTAGMRRAQEQLGTSDIAVIVRKYNSRSFGFASRNFYVAFLAALEIDANPEKYFGGIKLDPIDNSTVVVMPSFVAANQLVAALGLERETLHRLNPALLPSVWNGSRHVPRGYELRVPASIGQTAALDKLSGTTRFEEQVAGTRHRVRRGESLASIATRYGLSQARLAELNDLRRPYRIKAGQVLNLPGASGKAAPATPPVVAAVEPPPSPKPVTPSTGVVGTENRYVVKRGDTLSRIATKNGMTEEALMELNSIRNRNFVFEGQILALDASARVAPPVEAQVPIDTVVPLPASEPAAVAEAAEPESEREADELGPTLIPGAQSAQSADPSDYSVHDDNTVRVQAAETVGHYADWLEVRASQVRQLNRMSFATPVVIGHKLKLDFTKVTRDEFEAKRAAYHKQLQENFFTQFRITGDERHVIKSGESIWVLVQQRYNIPIWLLRQYNPDLDMGAVKPGTQLIVPTVESIVNGEPGT